MPHERSHILQQILPEPGSDIEVHDSDLIYTALLSWVAINTRGSWENPATEYDSPFTSGGTSFAVKHDDIARIDIGALMPSGFENYSVDFIHLPEKSKIRREKSGLVLELETLSIKFESTSCFRTHFGEFPCESLSAGPQQTFSKVMSTTEQGGKFSELRFNVDVTRRVSWQKQWSEQAAKELKYTDRLIKRLEQDFSYASYSEFFWKTMDDYDGGWIPPLGRHLVRVPDRD